MSTVEEHFARLRSMKPREGGWMTGAFHSAAAIFMGAHLDELEAAWNSRAEGSASPPPPAEGVGKLVEALRPFAAVWEYDDVPRHFPDMIYMLGGVRLNLMADDLRRASEALAAAEAASPALLEGDLGGSSSASVPAGLRPTDEPSAAGGPST